MMQQLRTGLRPSATGLVTPAELRSALESMEAQHKSVEAQVSMKSAQVEELTATLSAFDVAYVALQLESGTSAQLLDAVQSKLAGLGASQGHIAAAAKDAVELLVRLGVHVHGLELMRTPQGAPDVELAPRFIALTEATRRLEQTAALLALRMADLEADTFDAVSEYYEGCVTREDLEQRCRAVKDGLRSNAAEYVRQDAGLADAARTLAAAESDLARAEADAVAVECELAALQAAPPPAVNAELAALLVSRDTLKSSALSLAAESSSFATSLATAQQEQGSAVALLEGSESALKAAESLAGRAARELEVIMQDLKQLKDDVVAIEVAKASVAADVVNLAERAQATANARNEKALVDAECAALRASLALVTAEAGDSALDADLCHSVTAALIDAQAAARSSFTEPLFLGCVAASAAMERLGAVLDGSAALPLAPAAVEGLLAVSASAPSHTDAHDALSAQLQAAAGQARGALSSVLDGCCKGLPDRRDALDCSSAGVSALALATSSVVKAAREGVLSSAAGVVGAVLLDLGELLPRCDLGNALSAVATATASLGKDISATTAELESVTLAKAGFDATLSERAEAISGIVGAADAQACALRRSQQEKAEELKTSSASKLAETSARYALEGQKMSVDAAEVRKALLADDALLEQLTSRGALVVAALRQSRDAASAATAELSALSREPVSREAVEGSGSVQVLPRPEARRVGKSISAAAAASSADASSNLRVLPRMTPRSRRVTEDDADDADAFAQGDGADTVSPLAARPTRATDADRFGRVAKSVRFSTAAVPELGVGAASLTARVPVQPTSAASRASPSFITASDLPSLPRGSSPTSAPRSRPTAAAAAPSGTSSVYGQALLSYGTGGGGGGGSGKPPPRRAGLADAPPPHVRKYPAPSNGGAASTAGGGGRRAAVAAAPRPDDDNASVASQSSLFGSKLAMSRF